jgi:hypothetical protein
LKEQKDLTSSEIRMKPRFEEVPLSFFVDVRAKKVLLNFTEAAVMHV